MQQSEKQRLSQITTAFLRQTGADAWRVYTRQLAGEDVPVWDHVILTASNEEQAQAFRRQLERRLAARQLPAGTAYAVLPDPQGRRVGSGGATFNVLRYLAAQAPGGDPFAGRRVLVVHSGGDSRRIPQYSAVGKLFSPVPRALPDGRPSTLFDEFMVGLAETPGRMGEGMLVLSGDVLLQFNAAQLELSGCEAAALSMKESVDVGRNHGVFLNDGGWVGRFLHKQSPEALRALGAVNEQGCVDLDTGAVFLGAPVLHSLFSLISTGGRNDDAKFELFVNEQARISFYGDFLYPLAVHATLEEYYRQAPEGEDTPQLRDCRTRLWNVLSPYRLRLIRMAPAAFIHFGTTAELLALMNDPARQSRFGWQRQVVCDLPQDADCAGSRALADAQSRIGAGCYLENCRLQNARVGEGCIVSGVTLAGGRLPAHTVLHGLPLRGGGFVARVYGVADNPKAALPDARFLNGTLSDFMQKNQLTEADLWPQGGPHTLWTARLYPLCGDQPQALKMAAVLLAMDAGRAASAEREEWRAAPRQSLAQSFENADVAAVLAWEQQLEDEIAARLLCARLAAGEYHRSARQALGARTLTEGLYRALLRQAEQAAPDRQMRICYALAALMKEQRCQFDGMTGARMEDRCFEILREQIYRDAAQRLTPLWAEGPVRDVTVELPVRVNWGGGWTDTPPQCMELGGVVLNAALKLNGQYPVRVTVRRLRQPVIELQSMDGNVCTRFDRVEQLQNCRDVTDPFALHKAALIASGALPLTGSPPMEQLLSGLGGGFALCTHVRGVPQGSGLGTSSILAGACVKAIFAYLGRPLSDERLYDMVLCAEQLMSTGGGWQDQVGGLTPGVKYITTAPGLHQQIRVERLALSQPTRQELQQRFALIYTGQRRLARNLLRDVVGRYIGGQPEALAALQGMRETAAQMRQALMAGEIDTLAALFERHWQLSCQLDAGSTNTCIDHIFLACQDLIDGRFVAGAGGGGFLQVILKKDVTRAQLSQRLQAVFQDSGVQVWNSEFVYE